jgi:hypothetical protein
MSVKECTKCKETKPLADFHLQKKRGNAPRPMCKLCTNSDNIARAAAETEKNNLRSKKWRDANPEKFSARRRAWKIANPDRARRNELWARYHIEFDQMWEQQGGLCASCHRPMENRGVSPESVCVDHNRKCCPGDKSKSCGKCVRGLIHRHCNLMLGAAKEDPHVLQSGIEYLARHKNR